MALSTKIIDFIGLNFLQNSDQIRCISKVTVVHDKVFIDNVRVLVEVIYTMSIKRGCTAFYTVYFVAFFEKEFR